MTNQAPKQATIDDVAKLAGVSIATVSRAIRHPEKVAESTRKRVTAAIARTGYVANAMAQNLRMRRSQMVLVLTNSIAEPNFAGILTGMEKVANERGYGVLIGSTEGNIPIEEKYMGFLSTGMVDGLLLTTGHLPVAGWPKLPLHSLPPVIAVGRPVEKEDVCYVGIDDVTAAKVATEYLVSLGHKDVAYVSGGSSDVLSDLRHEGYKRGLNEASVPLQDWRIETDGTSEGGRSAVERMFIKDTLPSAFFCHNDNIAFGVVSALQLRGYNVPKDFSVVGFDDIPFSKNITPALTTIRQPRAKIGEEAMTRLLDRIADPQSTQSDALFHGDLMVRESCAQRQKT
ncbi:LacI family DNA-binding transcriptional regulator [Pseudooctadecabacter sp.]|uniref:LacI family DNA-binding transcriptional regulator n=1 Tax=Pseudooctadecabacter sp. TaxID=1966338 RepID=UPI0035C87E5E